MKWINQIVITFISTSWIWVIYIIEQESIRLLNSFWFTAFVLLLTPLMLTGMWWLFGKVTFSRDSIEGCQDIEEANGDFLADYLGYFFIGVGVDDVIKLFVIYIIIFSLTYLSQIRTFNPMLLFFGFKYYNLTTSNGTRIFLISRKSLRNPNEVNLTDLRRINDVSYIDLRR